MTTASWLILLSVLFILNFVILAGKWAAENRASDLEAENRQLAEAIHPRLKAIREIAEKQQRGMTAGEVVKAKKAGTWRPFKLRMTDRERKAKWEAAHNTKETQVQKVAAEIEAIQAGRVRGDVLPPASEGDDDVA